MSPQNRKQISADGTFRGLSTGSRATQFKPGASGNPGGRPHWVREIYERALARKIRVRDLDENGAVVERVVTVVDAIALNMIKLAMTPTSASIRAIEEIRKIVDGD
jgi:Family of unknown function (DUF5681)